MGNWSPSQPMAYQLSILLSAPSEPKLRVFPAWPTNDPKAPLEVDRRWKWGQWAAYRYRFKKSDLA